MSEALRHLCVGVYAACVDFMLNSATLLGVTYRDTNALVLIIGFPLTTFAMLIVCVWQRVRLWSMARSLRASSTTRTS